MKYYSLFNFYLVIPQLQFLPALGRKAYTLFHTLKAFGRPFLFLFLRTMPAAAQPLAKTGTMN